MPYFLALASAAVYGAADFLGGLAARRASTCAVVIVSQIAGLLLLAAMMPFLPDPLSVVVTLSSLYPASTVILARVVLGERLTAWQGAGIGCALVAVVLIVG